MAQGYAIGQSSPGSEYLLLAIAISGFAPYLTGLLTARLTDAFARTAGDAVPVGSLIAYQAFLLYTLCSVFTLSVISFFPTDEIVRATSVGILAGLANQVISLQQAYFSKLRRVALLFLQQLLLFFASIMLFLVVFVEGVNILSAMTMASLLSCLCIFILNYVFFGWRHRLIKTDRFFYLIRSSVSPLLYLASSLVYVAFISSERFAADLIFGSELKRFFFLVSAYIVFGTIAARLFRYEHNFGAFLILINFAIAAFGLFLWLFVQKFGEFAYVQEFWQVWAFPTSILLGWKVFQVHRDKKLYLRSMLLFSGLFALKVVIYTFLANGFVLFNHIFSMQCLAVAISFYFIWELIKLDSFTEPRFR